jgi:hypothetical protein
MTSRFVKMPLIGGLSLGFLCAGLVPDKLRTRIVELQGVSQIYVICFPSGEKRALVCGRAM